MEFIAIQKYLLSSPKKIRVVAVMVKKMKPQVAIDRLPFIGKRAAGPLAKVIKTAIANAKEKGVNVENLFIKEIQINEGPRLKRGRPVSRFRWHPYMRRMSHIRVVLATLPEKIEGKDKDIKAEGLEKTKTINNDTKQVEKSEKAMPKIVKKGDKK